MWMLDGKQKCWVQILLMYLLLMARVIPTLFGCVSSYRSSNSRADGHFIVCLSCYIRRLHQYRHHLCVASCLSRPATLIISIIQPVGLSFILRLTPSGEKKLLLRFGISSPHIPTCPLLNPPINGCPPSHWRH